MDSAAVVMADNNRKQSNASTDLNSPTAQQFPAQEGTKPPPANSATADSDLLLPPTSPNTRDERRGSDEWDAAKVPPSRFQKRKGSIYAVPSSRDGRIDSNYAAKFHAKLAEMGYTKK